MQVIVVASSKGGAGKSTVATNLAAYFALQGKRTALIDADRQKSSTHWCQKRAHLDSAVLPIDGSKKGWKKHLPNQTEVAIVDAAAGDMADDLEDFLEIASVVLVPVLPSSIDLEATVPFLDSLAGNARVKKGKLPVALVGNRLKPWTGASQQAMAQIKDWPYPVVAELRDTQAYVLMVALGKSLFDYHSEQVRNHQADWASLFKWIKKVSR
ncbi:MAG: ParA family protein [Arenimonas sp.]|nr:ParA family protein [Arenimonas sp.]